MKQSSFSSWSGDANDTFLDGTGIRQESDIAHNPPRVRLGPHVSRLNSTTDQPPVEGIELNEHSIAIAAKKCAVAMNADQFSANFL